MKKVFNVVWRVLALSTIVFVLVMNGCNSGSDGPTTPSIPDQHENMTEETAYSSEYWASTGENFFKINIPRSGDYKALYTTNIGSFEILFRLSSKSLVTVELTSGNVVEEIILQRGTITVNASQALEMFDDAEFTQDVSFGNLLLISGGAIVQSRPTPTPTPTPAATANPIPSNIPTPSPNASVVIAIGDSITYGRGSSVGGYPAYLEAMLLQNGHDVDVVNKGVGGEISSETDSRFSSEISGADVVLLMIGTNDIMGGACNAACTISHISSMLNKAASAGVRAIVSTVLPARSTSYYAAFNDDISSLNNQIRSLAAQKGVSYIDSYLLFNKSDAYFSDDIHPNDAGYERIAIEWYGVL